ncbi:hypothetical protein CMV30_11245 [Nibricoccus aquaticus]|uniref:Uncharacterized protein n=2 Tax=Nibricoccus aquaticus TaxID=2576891 RepID=A0A290QJH2_9BACT|nr:hypothetical protein CMV30_11245 [Nibricoccus aquaticus]
MKSWLVFLGGGVCGAAVALGVARIFFAWGVGVSVGATGGGVQAGAVAGVGGQVKSEAEKADEVVKLDERIGQLRAWTEGRGTEPGGDAVYETLWEWAERDPAAALAWVQGAKRLPQRLRMLSVPLAALAKKNPADAAAWMRQQVGAHDREEVLESVFQLLASASPKVALELVAGFPGSEQPDDLGEALGALMTDSPQEALGYFNRLSGERRINSARWMVGSWARKDAAAAMEWVEGQPDVAASQSVRWSLLEECAESRPDLCVEFLRKFPNSEDVYNDSRSVSVMLEKSPEHGMAALALVPAATAESALQMWARESFERSPERAIELVRKWVSEKERAGVIRSGFEAWLDSDQRAAMEWLGAVTEPQLQVTLQAGVIAWQAQRDPEAALAVLNGPQAAAPELQDVVAQALSGWTQRDVAGAAGWVVANAGLVTAEQASEVAGVFLAQDEAAGSDWLAKLPAGAARDAAVETAAMHWAGQSEPELATQVAGTIRDAEKRTRAFFSIYGVLRSRDGAAAEKWLVEAKDLSEETKQSWRALAGDR